MLGSTDIVSQVYRDLPVPIEYSRTLWEIKILGLTVVFVYTFFKFGWSFRLFNYSSILVGAVPPIQDAPKDVREAKAMKAAEMNAIAGKHFTSGLRGLFLAHKDLARKLRELEKRLEKHDKDIGLIFEAIRELMTPPDTAPKKLGFET